MDTSLKWVIFHPLGNGFLKEGTSKKDQADFTGFGGQEAFLCKRNFWSALEEEFGYFQH